VRARVVGVGQPAVGDDAVGLEVVRRLREEGVPEGTDLRECAEPSRLVDWFQGADTVVIVDAVVGGGLAGRIVEISPDRLDALRGRLFSTHGVGVAEALSLARTLHPEAIASRIVVVGITVPKPGGAGTALSPRVAASVPKAVAAVRRHLPPDAR